MTRSMLKMFRRVRIFVQTLPVVFVYSTYGIIPAFHKTWIPRIETVLSLQSEMTVTVCDQEYT